MNPDCRLPNTISPHQVIARIGLVSDTHMLERCADCPPALFDVLDGVALLLHAGDVGELWVLDRLSTITPVVALHGNDEMADAEQVPALQPDVTVAGQHILF